MNDDRLRLDLTDLADEVTPVDLRDRALRTSRRLGIQRAVVTSAAVVALFAAATGTAFAVMPRGDGPAPMPADTPSITLTPSPDDPSPTPSPSPERSVEPAVLGGTRYYLDLDDKEATVHAVRGTDAEVLARVPMSEKDPCARNSITISPDGRRLAWVRTTDGDKGLGTLITAGIDGANERTLANDVNCFGPTALVWKGSDLLTVRKEAGGKVQYDLDSGKVVLGPVDPTLDYWSADGRFLASVGTDGQPFVSGPGVDRNYDYTPPQAEARKWGGWSARSVSLDGRYVAVGWIGTDPSREDGSFAVVDTTTGKAVDLPVQGAVTSVLFTVDRKVIVRHGDGITVLDSRFRVLGEVAVPAAVRDMKLLAYVP